MRLCATAAVGTYTDKAGEHIVHRLAFIEADGQKDAEQRARADFVGAWPQCELLSVIIEPVPQ